MFKTDPNCVFIPPMKAKTRRQFLQQGLVLGSGLLLPKWALAAAPRKAKLILLHTNDFHSRLEAFPSNHRTWPNQGGIAGLGGRIMQERYRADYAPLPSYHLLVDSGDVFQGTPYFNLYGGQPELEWMSQMGYAASTLGNHEFDNGIEHLKTVHRQHAHFPLLSCNYHYDADPFFLPYTVVERGPIRIGLTGVGIHPYGLISERSMTGLRYEDPVEPLQKAVNHLRQNERCHLVIVLSHLGYQYDSDKIDDHKLAARTYGIDAILGGHTHTFLEEPVREKNAKRETVIINQAGWAGLRLGKLEFEVRL